MNVKQNKTFAAYVIAAAIISAFAIKPVEAKEADPIGPKLTPRLKQMLSEEMLSVKQASKQILDGLIVGDHSLVATQAQQIHDSFILARALTEQDKKDLTKAAPPEFLALDGQFHVTAKKLSEAALHKDYELQRFYYSRLVDSCQTCHTQFATDKFPAFSGAQPEGHSH
ncbi:MAG: hypothetical protein ROZ09_13255 [Thiobacillus sp.]|jgi:cytochrome c556|uniref:hypothetical protein n=1 Tax=Thiobacillus sp. TaxID=924 RepID=UPI0028957627|nr:hypothetical protein [Thiobacillus sp.]MDT3707784.1 hypothetical protein [Thiobacillus sp.]